MKILSVCFAYLLLTGCASHSVHFVHVDGFEDAADIDLSEAIYIESRSEQQVVLGLVFDTTYVDQAYQNLLNQCDGEIHAVSSQYSTTHGVLQWTNKILMKGVCLES